MPPETGATRAGTHNHKMARLTVVLALACAGLASAGGIQLGKHCYASKTDKCDASLGLKCLGDKTETWNGLCLDQYTAGLAVVAVGGLFAVFAMISRKGRRGLDAGAKGYGATDSSVDALLA